jgi:hypothetical protein
MELCIHLDSLQSAWESQSRLFRNGTTWESCPRNGPLPTDGIIPMRSEPWRSSFHASISPESPSPAAGCPARRLNRLRTSNEPVAPEDVPTTGGASGRRSSIRRTNKSRKPFQNRSAPSGLPVPLRSKNSSLGCMDRPIHGPDAGLEMCGGRSL